MKKEESKILQRIRDMFEEGPHPWYGPCDGFDNGKCAECAKWYGPLNSYFFWHWLVHGLAREEIKSSDGIIKL